MLGVSLLGLLLVELVSDVEEPGAEGRPLAPRDDLRRLGRLAGVDPQAIFGDEISELLVASLRCRGSRASLVSAVCVQAVPDAKVALGGVMRLPRAITRRWLRLGDCFLAARHLPHRLPSERASAKAVVFKYRVGTRLCGDHFACERRVAPGDFEGFHISPGSDCVRGIVVKPCLSRTRCAHEHAGG